ncbi:MAG TPA: class I adenylate-forming enzyme family protein, partial [Acidimicrobiales bacterium]
MTLLLLLEMVASTMANRLAIGGRRDGFSYQGLHDRAATGAGLLVRRGVRHLAYVGSNRAAFPVGLFASAWAGIPFIPLNYRLSRDQLLDLLGRHEGLLVLTDDDVDLGLDADLDVQVLGLGEWEAETAELTRAPEPCTTDGDDIAALLYTSGTTAAPKAVVLRHRHLASYVIGSVELAGAADDDAALVSVPPYHVAGLAGVVSNVYSGRRIVYLPSFTPQAWLATVADEGITHAMVVPTMLARIVDHLDGTTTTATAEVPTLRSLAYGGARMPATVLERALAAFPKTDFVNAYGLTETSSTIAVLGPDDHRAADRRRLSSVGRVVPGVEVDVRDGEIWVRGEQVSGEYLGAAVALDADGWFPTCDRGWLDDDGYLYVEGRTDDTIIRGGENIAPAEIEDVLLGHPQVDQAAVVGIPDEEWGQRIAAVVVPVPVAGVGVGVGAELTPEDLRDWARPLLRTAKTPDVIVFRSELPYTETGKLL